MPHSRSAYLLGERLLLIQTADALLARGVAISGIASPNPDVQKWAIENGIPCVDPCEGNDKLIEAVRAAGPFDYLLSVTYLRMIPKEVIAAAGRMAVNFHDSLLPTYAGLNATSWAIAAGETTHGITWHLLTDSPDTGDVLLQVPIEVDSDESALTLNTKCFSAATESLSGLIDRLLDDSTAAVPQDLTRRTYFGKHQRPSAAGWLDHRQTAQRCSALVRSLDFGDRFENPLALPKLWYNDQWWIVRACEVTADESTQAAGTIVRVDEATIVVATATNDISLSGLSDVSGQALSSDAVRVTFVADTQLGELTDRQSNEIDVALASVAKHELFWSSVSSQSLAIHRRSLQGEFSFSTRGLGPDQWFTLWALFLGKVSGRSDFVLGYRPEKANEPNQLVDQLLSPQFPVAVSLDFDGAVESNLSRVQEQLQSAIRRGKPPADLPVRRPRMDRTAIDPLIQLEFSGTAGEAMLRFDSDALNETLTAWLPQFHHFANDCQANPGQILGQVQLLSQEQSQVLDQRNETDRQYDQNTTIDREFFSQAGQTPDAIAITAGDSQWTYAELAAHVQGFAEGLTFSGVAAGDRVGVAMSRTSEMLAAVLAVMKVGAAYVPLDLEFPASRIELMIKDAKLRCILVDSQSQSRVPRCETPLVDLERLGFPSGSEAKSHEADFSSSDLAYVIYTSGSTGIPKGVMVSHRNAINFFAGMDDVIPHDPPGTWLAVTSLSFDISVLELLWTVCRGFKVVLHDTPSRMASAQQHRAAEKQIDFGLFYFSSSASEESEPYRMLLEGARFADDNGFSSVWTPERHFHDFGGPYPNPAVTSAAVAATTKHVAIRSGSVVLPLHHPARVAEEWAVVDRLSSGRVGVSIASGWQPNDFVLAPDHHGHAKQVMFDNLETVRRLWRGESIEMPGPGGAMVPVKTFPRPIQPELPVWITTAGNEETFRQAGERGFNILTHLLGQTPDELATKIQAYRAARSQAGHVGNGEVSVMVHTFVGEDTEVVKEIVRQPMIEYLRTSASLVRGFSNTWAAFKKRGDGTIAGDLNMDSLSEEDMDDLLAFSFERYFESSGLFGTPEKCLDLVRKLQQAGTTEIACLIDFGADTSQALAALNDLNQLRLLANADHESAQVATVSELVQEHQVTHFQCTPSMAQMLIEDEESKQAIESIPNVMLGGEALPLSLVRELKSKSRMRLVNVYGPTEATVWSTAMVIDSIPPSQVSIGKPIANTSIYILDKNLQRVADGVTGDLWIGGDGVVPGYWNRPELTAEKFKVDPFRQGDQARMYSTGDLARWGDDGNLEFLGRVDQQVKIRGHRIELGDIENAIDSNAVVRQSVVVSMQTDATEKKLVAFLVCEDSIETASDLELSKRLRADLQDDLPAHMIPSKFVIVEAFPLTPNGKVDRKSLAMISATPARSPAVATSQNPSALASSSTQTSIHSIWKETLELSSIGLDENFFDLGGHSLLAVRAHRMLRDQFEVSIAITDLFRYPTIRSLTVFLDQQSRKASDGEAPSASQPSAGQSRAAKRREMLQRRVAKPLSKEVT